MEETKFSLNQTPISTILAWVESGAIAIPEIQRPFVWTSSQVRDLMDSLYQGYPVGYIITWQNPDVRLKDGSTSQGKRILIDGQQRITALRAAISGLNVIDKNYKKRRIAISFNPITEEFRTRTSSTERGKEWIGDIAEVMVNGYDTLTFVDEYVAKNGGYMKLLERITNQKIQDVMPTMYNSEEIEKGGATVREMKVRSALQYGLNLGPFKLPKKEAK